MFSCENTELRRRLWSDQGIQRVGGMEIGIDEVQAMYSLCGVSLNVLSEMASMIFYLSDFFSLLHSILVGGSYSLIPSQKGIYGKF